MKPKVIIAIVGGIGIVGIVFAVQQSQITDYERQEKLELNLEKCDLNLLGFTLVSTDLSKPLSDWESCYESTFQRYGNNEQKIDWELNKDQQVNDLLNVNEEENPCDDLGWSGTEYSDVLKAQQNLEKCKQRQKLLLEENPDLKEYNIFSRNVLDCSKGSQHYVDRYNNEPEYQKWFDDNYPLLSMNGMDYLNNKIKTSCIIQSVLP